MKELVRNKDILEYEDVVYVLTQMQFLVVVTFLLKKGGYWDTQFYRD